MSFLMIRRLFTDHPASVGESYAHHLHVAGGFGLAMLAGAAACFVHALVPALFTRTGSGTIKRLHGRLHGHPARDGKRPDDEI